MEVRILSTMMHTHISIMSMSIINLCSHHCISYIMCSQMEYKSSHFGLTVSHNVFQNLQNMQHISQIAKYATSKTSCKASRQNESYVAVMETNARQTHEDDSSLIRMMLQILTSAWASRVWTMELASTRSPTIHASAVSGSRGGTVKPVRADISICIICDCDMFSYANHVSIHQACFTLHMFFSRHISGFHTAFRPRDALLSETAWH